VLFERLREKRWELASAAGLPPYVLFNDRTLVEMATYFPQSRDSLAKMTGVGEVKLEKYAADFLPIIQAYCRENQLEEKRKTAAPPPPVPRSPHSRPSSRMEEIAEIYNNGRSVHQIADDEAIKPNTVLNYLWEYARIGRPLRPDGLLELSTLPAAEQQRVLDAFAELGTERLRPVFDALGETATFEELKILRIVYLNTQLLDNKTEESDEEIDLDKLVVSMGKSGDRSFVPQLIDALAHSDGNVRRLAASALGKLRDERAVQPLLDLLALEEKSQVRQYAVKALGAIGDKRAQILLEQIAANEHEPYYIRQAAQTALRAIWQIAPQE
jgi:hypothetical protein